MYSSWRAQWLPVVWWSFYHNVLLTQYNWLFQVISGQYVCSNFSASTQVEVEIIGIPVDCAKHKTRVIPRNSLNPIWNDVFTFQVSKTRSPYQDIYIIYYSLFHLIFVCFLSHVQRLVSPCNSSSTLSFSSLAAECYMYLRTYLTFIFDFTAAGVVPCGGRKTSPRTSTIVQFIFYFGPLKSAIIFWEIRNKWLV